MISPTLLHLLRSPYWWHILLTVILAVFSWFAVIATQNSILKACLAILLLAAVSYINYVIYGLILSEKLREKFMRSDADWSGWHSIDMAMVASVGLLSFFGAIFTLAKIFKGIS
jgi:hypothetical protein